MRFLNLSNYVVFWHFLLKIFVCYIYSIYHPFCVGVGVGVQKRSEQYKKPTYRKHVKYIKKYNDFNLNGYPFERKFQRLIFVAWNSKSFRYKHDFLKNIFNTFRIVMTLCMYYFQ